MMVTYIDIPMLVLKMLMVYHSGANMSVPALLSPVMTLSRILSTLFFNTDASFADPGLMRALRTSTLILVCFCILFYHYGFEKEDKRPNWVKEHLV